jgi:class 3 adenylate cyclase
MSEQPRGTVSFLFSDIEGSTQLLAELGTERYAAVLERHRDLLRSAFASFDGYEVDCEGDAFFEAFPVGACGGRRGGRGAASARGRRPAGRASAPRSHGDPHR